MAYSLELADRIRRNLNGRKGIQEKRMFGSLVFLWGGNILVGIWHDSLLVRLGTDMSPSALQEPHVTEFDATGKPMKGWVVVSPQGLEQEEDLGKWIERATSFVLTLPPKV